MPARLVAVCHVVQRPPRHVGLDQHVLGRHCRHLHPAAHSRGVCRSPHWRLMEAYEALDYDVLIIGAGGAGLRAAIEAAAAGVKVAVVSKSLLGKAHTVMAEGGIAAAMANVDDRDNWR